MSATEYIELYNTLFLVSAVVAALGLVLSVFFFFYFDIRTVRALMTGKAREATIRRMAAQNARTGNLRMQVSGMGISGNLNNTSGKLGQTGRIGRKAHVVSQSSVQTEEILEPPVQQTVQTEIGATSVLQNDAPETVVLQAACPETTVLGSVQAPFAQDDVSVTTVLSANPVNIRFDVTETTLVIHTNEII